jgi:hypothetical protein
VIPSEGVEQGTAGEPQPATEVAATFLKLCRVDGASSNRSEVAPPAQVTPSRERSMEALVLFRGALSLHKALTERRACKRSGRGRTATATYLLFLRILLTFSFLSPPFPCAVLPSSFLSLFLTSPRNSNNPSPQSPPHTSPRRNPNPGLPLLLERQHLLHPPRVHRSRTRVEATDRDGEGSESEEVSFGGSVRLSPPFSALLLRGRTLDSSLNSARGDGAS